MKRTDKPMRKLWDSILAVIFAAIVLGAVSFVDWNSHRNDYPTPEIDITNKQLTPEQMQTLAELRNPMIGAVQNEPSN